MNSRILKVSPLANDDLFDIFYFIAIENHNPQKAGDFINQLEVFHKLAKKPAIGLLKSEYGENLHQFPYKRYLIFTEYFIKKYLFSE